jgi:tRNA uridine 5-carboxymethylaminomethyl modification enzyme
MVASLDYSKMNEEKGDAKPMFLSGCYKPLYSKIMSHDVYSLDVHDILREGFDRSPMFNGRIKSLGPRYCPSIEDKINRFADKERHQLLLSLKVGILVRCM